MTLARRFPPEFVFGVATAAFQIEGAASEDGRKPSIWDAFSHMPGRVENGDTGDVACDHYHRMESDLDLIASLGVDAYRFSIAWPRVIPEGRGAINDKGLDFYERLLDGILARGLKPFATLYHWDLPLELQGRGGWTSRETAHAFAVYAEVVAKRLGDRLSSVATLNEPWCSSFLGHFTGEHAPGERNLSAFLASAHTLNLAHGLAVQAMRAVRPDTAYGIVLNAKSLHPASAGAADIAATGRFDAFHNGLFFEPLFNGRYPDGVSEALGSAMPAVTSEDLAVIRQPLDFLGINYYTPEHVAADPSLAYPAARAVPPPLGTPVTDMGWEIDAGGLSHLIRQLRSRYALPPIYITENGGAFRDACADGAVHDPERVAYLRDHLSAVADLVEGGSDVRGYFAWSLMDNFEWAWGYAKRFGLVHVDYASQERTIKDSGHWYRDLIGLRDRSGDAAA
nr:GH1 family beta-glucosidase [Chthonobacter albigriseus]